MEPVKIIRRDGPLTPHEMFYAAMIMETHMKNEIAKGHPLAILFTEGCSYRFLEFLQNTGRLEVYTVDDVVVGILGYDVADIPWLDRKVLKEMTVFAISDLFCGFGRTAVERLNELAIENDCAVIETGDSLNVNTSMSRNIYMKRGGFTGMYPCYFKTIVPQIASN